MDICFFIITLYSFIIAWRHAGEAMEIFGKERGVGKVHLLSYLCRRLVCVAQFYFDAGDEGTVNPVFGGSAAGLADDGSQVSLGETHALGIVAYLVMLGTMLCDQLKETVEDGLLVRTTAGLLVGLLAEQMVIVVHLGCYEGSDGGTMIVVGSMNRLPDSV